MALEALVNLSGTYVCNLTALVLIFYLIFPCMDPDPYAKYGSTKLYVSNADPDPQHSMIFTIICRYNSIFRVAPGCSDPKMNPNIIL